MGLLLSVVSLDDEQNKAPRLAGAAKSRDYQSNPCSREIHGVLTHPHREMLTYSPDGPLWSGAQGTQKFDEEK